MHLTAKKNPKYRLALLFLDWVFIAREGDESFQLFEWSALHIDLSKKNLKKFIANKINLNFVYL